MKLTLNSEEIIELIRLRDTHSVPYIRERASAILKINSGMSPRQVALEGLLKRRKPDTVYKWLYRYVALGVSGLFNQKRKNCGKLSEGEKKELVQIILKKTPYDFIKENKYSDNREKSSKNKNVLAMRWSLRLLHQYIDFLKRYKELSGIWRLLQRLGLRLKRGRCKAESNDADYNYKLRRIRGILGYCLKHRDKAVFLCLDEFSFYRQPVVNRAWWKRGKKEQPIIKRARKSNTRGRIVACVNCATGRVDYKIASKIKLPVLCKFIEEIRQIYSDVKIYILMDNWYKMHDNEKFLRLLKDLNITPVYTPTYTPEANPIERLWWKLTKEVIYHHRLSENWQLFKERITLWLEQFKRPSADILRQLGLTHTNRLIHANLKT